MLYETHSQQFVSQQQEDYAHKHHLGQVFGDRGLDDS